MPHNFEKELAEALFKWVFQNDSPPSDFYLRLMDSDGDEIPAGNGYDVGGEKVTFSDLASGSNYAQVDCNAVTFVPITGTFPVYGDIRFVELTDDSSPAASRQRLARFDLGESITVPDNKQLRVIDATIKLQKSSLVNGVFTINGLKGLLEMQLG